MMARGLDRIVESNINRNTPPDFDENRRLFLKWSLASLSILAGIKFAGCSSKVSESIEFKSQNSSQSDYKLLVFPKNAPEVPDEDIHYIEEIGGGRGFEALPPGELTCAIKVNGKFKYVLSTQITPNERIFGLASATIPNPIFGNIGAYENEKTGRLSVQLQYFEELPKFIDFGNKYINLYSSFIIRGIASNNKGYLFIALVGRDGGNVAADVFVQNPKNPKEYELYVFKNKEKLDRMMQTIFNELAKNPNVPEYKRRILKNYAEGNKWRLLPEDYYQKKKL